MLGRGRIGSNHIAGGIALEHFTPGIDQLFGQVILFLFSGKALALWLEPLQDPVQLMLTRVRDLLVYVIGEFGEIEGFPVLICHLGAVGIGDQAQAPAGIGQARGFIRDHALGLGPQIVHEGFLCRPDLLLICAPAGLGIVLEDPVILNRNRVIINTRMQEGHGGAGIGLGNRGEPGSHHLAPELISHRGAL